MLVATTVIEVGVDVPNASIMVIEHAERFGLAQLHQLRGRVGRGAAESTCVLLFEEPLDRHRQAAAQGRSSRTTDGFEIARQDLLIRGPGEFLGARQSGVPLLRFADLERDVALIEQARDAAEELLRTRSRGRRSATSSAGSAAGRRSSRRDRRTVRLPAPGSMSLDADRVRSVDRSAAVKSRHGALRSARFDAARWLDPTMSLYTLGLNHTTAPLDVRERVAFAPDALSDALRDLTRGATVKEAAILSTCNRTEVYFHGGEPEPVARWLEDVHRLPPAVAGAVRLHAAARSGGDACVPRRERPRFDGAGRAADPRPDEAGGARGRMRRARSASC